MNATDLAAVIIAIAALLSVGLAVWLVSELRRATDTLRKTLDTLQKDTVATVDRLGTQADAIDAELGRAGGLLDTAERVSARADILSKVTYGAVAKPVIRTAAVFKGTTRAARRLRRGDSDTPADTDSTVVDDSAIG